MFLTTILLLSMYYQFPSDISEHFAKEVTADEEYAKALDIKSVELNDPINISSSSLQKETPDKFAIRQQKLDKLRDSLKSSHELMEKSFDVIKKKGANSSTVFDNDIFDRTTYYEFQEGEYSGINKCYSECNGNCLEFGYTGHAWCFPNE